MRVLRLSMLGLSEICACIFYSELSLSACSLLPEDVTPVDEVKEGEEDAYRVPGNSNVD